MLLSSCAQVAGLAERLEMHSLAAATYEKMLRQLGGDPTGRFRDVQMRVVTVKFAEATHSALTRHELRSALISINLEGSRREKGIGEESATFPSPELSKSVASKLAEASTPTASGSKATSSVSSYFDSLMDAIVYDNDVKEEQKSNEAGNFTPAEQLACLYVFVEAHEHAKEKKKSDQNQLEEHHTCASCCPFVHTVLILLRLPVSVENWQKPSRTHDIP